MSLAEGFSESVSRLLVEDWRNVDYLFASPHSSAKFRAFVVRHVDETIPTERMRKIASNAWDRCPVGGVEFCDMLKRSVSASTP